jgi:hypothetical protein
VTQLTSANRDSAPTAPTTGPLAGARRLLRRWPTALALGLGALTVADLTVDESLVDGISALLTVMVLVYVGAAALGRRRAAWPILLLGLPVLFLPSDTGATATYVLLAATALFAAYGAIRARRRDPHGLPLQTLAAIAVAGLALVAIAVDPTTGARFLAVALLGHAAWDAYHYVRDRVVTRSYAEFCAVVDAVLGVAILAAV